MPLLKLNFRPGINKDQTNYSGEGGWWDSDKVRFFSGFPQKLGGWRRAAQRNILGACRQMFNWTTTDGSDLMAMGTDQKAYVEVGGNLEDITPISVVTTPVNPFSTTAGTNIINVFDPSGFFGPSELENRFIRITQAYEINGIPASALIGVHEITYISSSNYSFEVEAIATGSGSLNGLSGTGQVGDVGVTT